MTSGLGSTAANTSGGSDLYGPSKSALDQFARSFAAAEAGRGLTVLCLHS